MGDERRGRKVGLQREYSCGNFEVEEDALAIPDKMYWKAAIEDHK